ncbi:lantibiotic dehydratase [Streptomyces niveus]|uniref:lantibiotic dehydratase n=1 Tax=Streptomyces niveus TaxID=193462 RepID=UPI0036C930B0
MPLPLHFTAEEPLLIRVTSLPGDTFDDATREFGRHHMPENGGLVDYIRTITSVALLREAIAVSSQDLSETLRRIDAGETMTRKKLIRTVISVTRYAQRITGRPTPFGLHSGVAAVSVDDRSRAVIRSAGEKSVRFDAAWFDQLAREWLESPEIRHACDVVMNDLCHIRGERLVLPHVRQRETPRSFGKIIPLPSDELSLRVTPVLSWVASRAGDPVGYADLLAAAVAEFPEHDERSLERFLADLVRREVLLTELSAVRLDERWLDSLAGVLPRGSSAARDMDAARGALASYASTKPGGGEEEWWTVIDAARRMSDGESAAPQVDLHADVDVAVPADVGRELASCASALWEMSAKDGLYEHMKLYRRAFVDMYGQDGAVPLAELIDPHRGLGFPATYLHPRVSRGFSAYLRSPSSPAEAEARSEYLAALAFRGLMHSDREISLTEEDVSRLTVLGDGVPPRSVELCFQILAGSTSELDAGRFRLALSPAVGTTTAGALAGRFAELTGSSASLTSLMGRTDDDALPAQVSFLPVLPRALNVMQVPDLFEHVIPVGIPADRRDPRTIDWRRLIVAADGDRLRLHLPDTGQEVLPVLPHVVSLSMAAPNLVRFLQELRYCADVKIWQPWDWAESARLPCLPRVRLGRTVLAPLTWRPSASLTEAAADTGAWESALASWARDLRVSRRVNVTQGDRTYEIDLDNAFHREMLRRDLSRSKVVLSETVGDSGAGCGWLSGRSHEIVLPLRRAVPSVRPGSFLDPERTSARVVHPPGGEWAYLKLHGLSEVHEEIISGHLPRFIRTVAGDIDRWFFMRYKETGHQIRLRLHGERDALRESVWPRLLEFAESMRRSNLIQGYDIAAYEPESVRYGGPAGMRAAESLFCLDSQLVAQELRRLARGSLGIPRNVLMAAQYACMLDALGAWDWREWLVAKVPRSPGPGPSPAKNETELASRLIEPGRTATLLSGHLPAGCGELLGLLSEVGGEMGKLLLPRLDRGKTCTRHDMAVLSLLHMQHNRLVGIDPSNEQETLAVLVQVARAQLSRQRYEKRIGQCSGGDRGGA